MAITPLRERLGALVKHYLRERGIRQLEVARQLGLTGSAVSQMLIGKIVFNMQQLHTICDMLALDQPQRFELQALLSRIRNGEERMLSQFNRSMYTLRCQRGISSRQLSLLTGIPYARVRALEEDPDVIVSHEDAVRIAPVLNCTPEALQQSASYSLGNPNLYNELPRYQDPLLVAAENARRGYSAETLIPMLTIPELLPYDGVKDILDYADDTARDSLPYELNLKAPVFILKAEADALGFGFAGELLVFIGRAFPENYRNLTLTLMDNGNLYLLEETDGVRRNLFRQASEPVGEIRWQLPVLEIVFRPLKPNC